MSDTHRTPDPAQPEEARTPQGEASPPPAEAKEKKPGAFGADVYTWLQALVVALTVLLLFFTFFGRVIGVDGHSMDPTLNDGDLLFLQCVGYEPQQGDVVVLHKDFGDITTPIVKRVIAVGGQTVEIDYTTSTVYVDGVPLEEDYILEPMEQPDSPYAQETYWEVPEGSVRAGGVRLCHGGQPEQLRRQPGQPPGPGGRTVHPGQGHLHHSPLPARGPGPLRG